MPGRMFPVRGPGNGLADHYIDAIAAALDKSRRPATLRAYERAWERFRVWAVSEGLEPLPADPLTVAAYLAYRAGIGRSASTLAMDRKAISYHHGKRGYRSPTATEGVKATLAGLRNQAAEEGRGDPKQARGLTASALQAIERTAHRVPRAVRNRSGPHSTGGTWISPWRR